MVALSEKNVGDIVKIKENDADVNFIIIHKGNPDTSMYDDSCDGVWLLRETIHSTRAWDGTSNSYDNDYENSDIKAWLNGDYLNSIDEKIRAAIKTVKIPFKIGTGNGGGAVQSGANGLSCKVFLISGYEVGFTTSTNHNLYVDGARLSYFLDNTETDAKNKRIAKNSSNAAAWWWLRSPFSLNASHAFTVGADGVLSCGSIYSTSGSIRPAFVLPSSLLVDTDGIVSTNTPPTITSDKTGNLGTLASGFTCNYSVNDSDSVDSVSVTLTLDSSQVKKFTATKGKLETYTLGGTDWLKVTSGAHSFKITATDGRDTTTSTTTFTRSVNSLSVTLDAPFEADDKILVCLLNVEGSIPEDAICKYEVTNNANDSSPVWEDCTAKSKAGLLYAFENKTAANGFAFNFRVSIERGPSNVGGFISRISGQF